MNAPRPPRPGTRPGTRTGPRPERRGAALIIAMLLVAGVLVVSAAFLHSGVTAARVHRNVDRTDHARRAARAGAIAALAELQSPGWPGVGRTTVGDLGSRDGVPHGYRIEYKPVVLPERGETAPPYTPAELLRAALQVEVRVEGTHGRGDEYRAPATVGFTVELRPRVGKDGGPDDRAFTPDGWQSSERADWQTLTAHAVTAANPWGGTGLTLGPQSRIAGDVWLRGSLDLFEGPSWSREHRRTVLEQLGTHAPGSTVAAPAPRPAPLSGRMLFSTYPSWTVRDGLQRLRSEWEWDHTRVPRLPPNTAPPETYQVFVGGPRYAVEPLGALLTGNEGPNRDNPLGLFRAAGDVRVTAPAIFTGTLLAGGEVRVTVDEAQVARDPEAAKVTARAPRWENVDGTPFTADAPRWPRLPAVRAGGDVVVTHGEARVDCDGAVLAGGDVTLPSQLIRWEPILDGRVDKKLKRRGEDRTEIRLDRSPRDAGVRDDGTDSIRFGSLPHRWPIVRVEHNKVEVRGVLTEGEEAGRGDRFFIDRRLSGGGFTMDGPLAGRRVTFPSPDHYTELSRSDWDMLFGRWNAADQPDLLPWLADSANWHGLGEPYESIGLSIEPVNVITHNPDATGAQVAFSPPLFRPDPAAAGDSHGGYRWEVLSWTED